MQQLTPATCSFLELLAYWLTAIGTLLLGFIAVFQDSIRERIRRPKLNLTAVLRPPACHKTMLVLHPMGAQYPCHYFRLGITNTGNTEAKQVQLYLASVKKKRKDTEFDDVDRFLPMNL